ncbi:MAG: acyltransferase family protein [Corynebacterium sp.]|nr:acyltransferase family protein [Corynebacterium sp.]
MSAYRQSKKVVATGKNAEGIRNVPGIRGLRALAVLAVVVYHYLIDVLPGGYLGVDLFFVLSGFLITSLLLREHMVHGRISLRGFWVRRIRRILPAALTVLLVASAVAGLIGGDVTVHLVRQFFSSLFFVNNWVQIANSQSYFADSELPIFAHYWSLSIEEQFYIIWPLVIVFLFWRGRSKHYIRNFALVLAVASAVWMAIRFVPGEDPTRVYYGTDTHAFGLLIGAALAALTVSQSTKAKGNTWSYARRALSNRRMWALVGPFALAAQLACFYFLGDQETISYRGGLVFSSLISGLLILTVVRQAGIVHHLFSLRILQWIGDRSFSIYLWHVPVHVFLVTFNDRHSWGWTDLEMALVAVLLTIILSVFSYRWIEEPFRTQGYWKLFKGWWSKLRTPNTRQRIRPVLACVSFLVVVGMSATALANQNTESDMERELRLAEEASKQQDAEKARELEKKSKREMPTGDQITAIGDSVLLASAAALQEEFPGIYVDGEVSRHYQAASGIIASMEAAGTLDPFVLLSFGTNGQAFPDQLDELIDQLGEDRVIIVTLPYGDRWYMADAQQQAIDAAEQYENVYALNWCGFVMQDPSVLRGDGIHPDALGAAGFAKELRKALQQWVDDEKEIPQVCGP